MNYILSIYDSLSKRKKIFNLTEKKNNPLNIYVCGITPYDHPHIGHARCYISYDILIRLIRYFGFKVTYIQNITDVNDKIFSKAINWYGDATRYLEVANFYHNEFQSLLNKVGCLAPDSYPRVSESFDAIINLIQKIINAGCAYETNDGIYFNVNTFKEYGKLSQRNIDDEKNVSRIENLHDKNSNYDFVLWKKTNELPCWESPWGKGLPGWHIECSAMINKSFGNNHQLNIHGGGIDLLFPHHENEKAQSECCSDKPLTDIWMHVAFINANKEKMSKSMGNSVYLKDIINQFDPMAFRLYLLMHHYNSPIEFDLESIRAIQDSYLNLISIFENTSDNNNKENKHQHHLLDEINQLLLDNLNTAAAIGLIFKNKQTIKNNIDLAFEIKKIVKYIFGLSLKKENNYQQENSQHIEKLLFERELARKNKDFAKADELRKILVELGAKIHDGKL